MTIKQLYKTSLFKSDFKKFKNKPSDLDKLNQVVDLLRNGKELEPHHKKHKLYNNYQGCWECHIRPNLLLIWEENELFLDLKRLGSHTELFDKVRKR